MERVWWKEAVVYQIYPRSFQDSNGDGIGDLRGIVARLDYLKELGVDVVWLCPVYSSPNDDNGYDISDYQAIHPDFGTLSDWRDLVEGLHVRGMRLIMDLVVNHTSDEHPWFLESRSSKSSPKRDWYIWHDGRNGEEPNNWASFFEPSAWTLDPQTNQYYLHLFSKKQPDLNWRNPNLREELFRMMNWWLDQGVDGFRMDVINLIAKSSTLPDSPLVPVTPGGKVFDLDQFANRPGVHRYLQELHERVLLGRDVMTVGETPGVTPKVAAAYCGPERRELDMVFQFELMEIDSGPRGKWELTRWDPRVFQQVVTRWQTGMAGKGWNSLYLNNHDQPRLVSRFGEPKAFRLESAKALATMLYTLQGTPFLYQGEEIGMTNAGFTALEQYRDIESLRFYEHAVGELHWDPDQALQSLAAKGRDNARTPMQWDATLHAGFTDGTPWIGVNTNHLEINVEEARSNRGSLWHYYKRLIQLRKANPVLVYGTYRPIHSGKGPVFCYSRELEGESWITVVNLSSSVEAFSAPSPGQDHRWELVLGNYPDTAGTGLRPWEARVLRITKKTKEKNDGTTI